jgi:phosphoserine phosphatase
VRTYHWLSDRVLSIIRLPPPDLPPASVLRKDPEVAKFEAEYHVEVVLHIHQTPVWIARQFVPIKLAVFDMDSTLIEQEVIDELAASVGAGPVVATITRRAMEGKIDFEQSLRERVALLKGVPTQIWDDLKHKIIFADGARDLCKVLKVLQVKMAVLSGGFIQMADWAKDELGLDHAHANHVRFQYPSPTKQSFKALF